MVEKYYIYDLENSRGKKKGKFETCKDNTLKSLNEVEGFLCNWRKVLNGIKLYNILRLK